MDTTPIKDIAGDGALEVIAPAEQTAPVVFASPHSGRNYPEAFVAASLLDPLSLRKSEDSFVDELFAAAPRFGAPLIRALFPRAYVDPNREPYELDPAMFEDALPDYANTTSPRVLAGLGTIARVVANGAEIYGGRLRFAEAERRIATFYRPYHQALRELVEATAQRFGCCLLVDCHSMPSSGRPEDRHADLSAVDIVLGDCYGSACAAAATETAEAVLRRLGYRVVRNAPYAGGFTTRHYSRPHAGRHALQIEINRRLYMDEATHRRGPGFAKVAEDMTAFVAELAGLSCRQLESA